ncbi:MAG: TIGR03619 family F420-dependent LLM class oxidoreductase [Armatimonadetes bacterium]|nr:TIGR03619 family F420-dependent LLM class oxidoreductase [Armatimonadota bacterium]
MRIGVKLPTSGPLAGPEAIRAVAQAADSLGYDSVWVQDHVTRSPDDAEHHFAVGAWEAWMPPVVPHVYEAMSTLVYLAGLTTRVRLGTSALVLPLRNPVWLAKEAATLDQFSGGRLILGVAVGGAYVRRELAAIGVPELAKRRGEVVDEWIDVIRGVWRESRYSHRGTFITVEEAQVFPRPAQRWPPIWIGGTSRRAMARVARRGDGWLAIWLTPDEVREGAAVIRDLAAAEGRDPKAITICSEHWMAIDRDASRAARRSEATRRGFSGHISALPGAADDNVASLVGREDQYSLVGDPPAILDRLGRYREAGADLIIIRSTGHTLVEVIESLHMFKEEVVTPLRS